MNTSTISLFRGAALSIFICLFVSTSVYGGGYEALDGLNDIKVVFDVRASKAKTAAIYLDLIHQTFKDQNIRNVTQQPDFVVVLAGGTTKLVSSATKGLSAEDKASTDQIAKTISAMKKDGIKVKICLYAANLLGVDAATILPEIEQVENGWISLLGYQAKGYSLVAAF